MSSARELSDAELVARCRGGDEAAWRELVERFARYVHAICVTAFRLPPHDAEDVFQDVFAKTWAELPKLRDDGAIRPWLAQLTRRTCIDRLRAARPAAEGEPAELPDPDDVLGRLEQALDVHRCMTGLGESCNEILDRFFARDESYRAIGEALDLPAGTIASRISRCLDKLRAAMEDPASRDRPVDG
ncbi:MAG TPA: sigma-70 family RNA polymerase sigma factor [Gaiellaceae bacterium]|nr:sigma-70 family RNA polymerase sigma factor [Gaiellaceae bacterium]